MRNNVFSFLLQGKNRSLPQARADALRAEAEAEERRKAAAQVGPLSLRRFHSCYAGSSLQAAVHCPSFNYCNYSA